MFTKSRLINLINDMGIIKTGEFVLSSGQKSNFYFDVKALALSSLGIRMIAEGFASLLDEYSFDSVGGHVLGCCPLVTALQFSFDCTGFYYRGVAKEHGTKKDYEGVIGERVVIVEDVITTGKSVLATLEFLKSYQTTVVAIVVVINRSELRELNGIPVLSLLDSGDF